MADKTKRDLLTEYVEKRHERQEKDYTCQFKGGQNEKFCRATRQRTCEGCRFYKMSIWEIFNRAYDLLIAKNKRIQKLEVDKCRILNYLEYVGGLLSGEAMEQVIKTVEEFKTEE